MTAAPASFRQPRRTLVAPWLALVVLVPLFGRTLSGPAAWIAAAALTAAVLTAVHHAEVVAARVGEPYGTLTLAVAVTVIEVALIVALSVGGDAKTQTLARDTVFAAIMITCNGMVGVCLLAGLRRGRTARFQTPGAIGAISTIATLSVLALVLPVYTTSAASRFYTPAQLVFAAAIALFLYGTFVFVQTIRDREYFLPIDGAGEPLRDPKAKATSPARRDALVSVGLLLVCLVAVVGLAKTLSPTIESFVLRVGAPITVVGIVISGLVLLPESIAALRAARRDRLQTSLNLAYGSALATIGLTIPAIAVFSLVFDRTLILGLSATDQVLLALTVLASALTVVQGRATALQAAVHLSLFASFLFLALVP